MRLDRRQLLALTARAASTLILSACGRIGVTPSPQPPRAPSPRPTAPATPTPREEMPTALPALPATSTAPPRAGVQPSSSPTAPPTADPAPPGAQANGALQPPVEAIPATYFGMHIHQATTTTPWPMVPFGAWRLWDAGVTWPDLEPGSGNWNFKVLDQYAALAEKHNVDLLLPLGLTPTWASARPDEPSPHFRLGNVAGPKYIEDWRRYISTVARRYKGRIRNYEIWNEPNLKEYWTGTTKELINLAHEASQILREIDPTITIVGPSATDRETGPAWLDEYLSAGGGIYLDAIAHHLYVFPSPPEALTPFIGRVRQIMAKHGMSNKPLWNSELGWSLPKLFPSDREAVGYLARAYLLNWIGGVQRCYWYAWDNQEWATLRLTERNDQTLTPAGVAYGEIENWLVDSRIVEYTIDSMNTHMCRVTSGDDATARILWNPDRELSFPIPQGWGIQRVRDLGGGRRDVSQATSVPIDAVPLLLE